MLVSDVDGLFDLKISEAKTTLKTELEKKEASPAGIFYLEV